MAKKWNGSTWVNELTPDEIADIQKRLDSLRVRIEGLRSDLEKALQDEQTLLGGRKPEDVDFEKMKSRLTEIQARQDELNALVEQLQAEKTQIQNAVPEAATPEAVKS